MFVLLNSSILWCALLKLRNKLCTQGTRMSLHYSFIFPPFGLARWKYQCSGLIGYFKIPRKSTCCVHDCLATLYKCVREPIYLSEMAVREQFILVGVFCQPRLNQGRSYLPCPLNFGDAQKEMRYLAAFLPSWHKVRKSICPSSGSGEGQDLP